MRLASPSPGAACTSAGHILRRVELVVRALTWADLPTVEAWFDDPATARWLGGRDWPRALVRRAEASADRLAFAAVIDTELVALADIDKHPGRRAAVAVVVDPARRGHGLAATFLRALQDHPDLGDVDEYFGGVEQGNDSSLRLMDKIAPQSRRSMPDPDGFTYITWRRQRPTGQN
jgi:RimJ/RimL family protein N-acetyltransferase